jgi:predicted RNA-binding Zn-ribbon protein involved in translation (DUF1610 family)
MAISFPPPGFVLASSAVEGIDVYMPSPVKAKETQEVVEFNCPQCGATTAFSAADGGLKCSHCGFYQPPSEKVVGRNAAEAEFTIEIMERAATGWGRERKDVECQQCGARISVPPESLAASCPFCGSNKVIQRVAAQDELRPRFLVPFKVEAARCQQIATQWLGSSWMTPRGLQNLTSTTGFSGVYLPFWTFDATTRADWKAEVGHTETESYYDDGEWKTRLKTVWRWESGHVQLPIDDLLIEGTHRLSNLLLGKIKNFDMSALTPYDPEFLAGFQAQGYDVSLEQGWGIGRQQMREQTRQACEAQASSSQIRNFNMSLDFADESWRYILLPTYLAAYIYQEKSYQVMVNGQTEMIAGQRPVDWNRVWLVITAFLAPGLLVGLAGLVTIPLAGVGVAIGGVGLVLLVIGIVFSIVIFIQAQRMDDV